MRRELSYRQGDILNVSAGELFDAPNLADGKLIVITHDCDLANVSEKYVEVISGHLLESHNAEFIGAKNPRKLHLRYSTNAGDAYIELEHSNRHSILHDTTGVKFESDPEFILHDDERRILKQWLASRYGRPAFPDEFENRLRTKCNSSRDVSKQIAHVLKDVAEHIVAVLFDLGEGRRVELEDTEPYFLRIYLVCDSINGAFDAFDRISKKADDVKNFFHRVYGTPDTAEHIALEECQAKMDYDVTLLDMRRMDNWRLEYISTTAKENEDKGDYLQLGDDI